MKLTRITILIVFILIGIITMALNGACTLSTSENNTRSNTLIATELEDKSTFDSSVVMNKMSVKEHLEMYWKFFFEKGEKIPMESLPQQHLQLSKLFDGKGNGLKASWLGHSSVLINIDGYSILTDPIFESKVSLVGPTRFNKALVLNIEELSSVDVVIISHDHYDHLNKFSIQQLSEKTGIFVVPLRVGKRLLKWGVPETKIVELNWWDAFSLQGDLTIVATPAQHFSGRGLFDRNSTLWASWVIKTSKHNIFFSGDSGYFGAFKEIGKKYGPFDITFLECGAYNKQWSKIHMFPEETLQASLDLGGKILQPIHWATFNLALHPWYEPIERLTTAAQDKKDVIISTPVMGEVVDYEMHNVSKRWWLPAMERSREYFTQRDRVVDYNQ